MNPEKCVETDEREVFEGFSSVGLGGECSGLPSAAGPNVWVLFYEIVPLRDSCPSGWEKAVPVQLSGC